MLCGQERERNQTGRGSSGPLSCDASGLIHETLIPPHPGVLGESCRSDLSLRVTTGTSGRDWLSHHHGPQGDPQSLAVHSSSSYSEGPVTDDSQWFFFFFGGLFLHSPTLQNQGVNADIHTDNSQGRVLSKNHQIKPKLIIARKYKKKVYPNKMNSMNL